MKYLIGAVLVLLALMMALLHFGPPPHRTSSLIKYGIGTVLVLSLVLAALLQFGPMPHYTKSFKTPLPGVTLTYETDSLPLTSDSNWLTAHYEHNGKTDSKVILYGDDASFYRYVWVGPERLELCWRSGNISGFTNDVDLRAGGGAQHFHVALREDCTPNF